MTPKSQNLSLNVSPGLAREALPDHGDMSPNLSLLVATTLKLVAERVANDHSRSRRSLATSCCPHRGPLVADERDPTPDHPH
jgi:hypothetical protein